MYLRFVQMNVVAGARSRAGIFTAAYDLRDAGKTDVLTRAQLDSLLVWFRENLASPTRFSRTNSKGAYRRSVTHGLSWYKPSAKVHLEKTFELSSILQQNGYGVEVLKTSRLGYILYEDEHQIVAEPFADGVS